MTITLKGLRLRANLTQDRVADAINISQTSVSLWEAGKTVPKLQKVKGLANLYNCTIDDIITATAPAINLPDRKEDPEKTDK